MCQESENKTLKRTFCFGFQLALLGTKFAGHTSSTAPESPGWTRGRQPCPLPTTTTHGRLATSANPACTPPAPATPAAAAPAQPPCRHSLQRLTPVLTSTVSLLLPRKTCPQTLALLLPPPPRPGWTTRSRSSTRYRWRTGWRWRAVVRFAAVWPRWTLRPRPRITPSRPTRPTLCRPTSTVAVSSTQAVCLAGPPPASRLNAKARPGRAQVSLTCVWVSVWHQVAHHTGEAWLNSCSLLTRRYTFWFILYDSCRCVQMLTWPAVFLCSVMADV